MLNYKKKLDILEKMLQESLIKPDIPCNCTHNVECKGPNIYNCNKCGFCSFDDFPPPQPNPKPNPSPHPAPNHNPPNPTTPNPNSNPKPIRRNSSPHVRPSTPNTTPG